MAPIQLEQFDLGSAVSRNMNETIVPGGIQQSINDCQWDYWPTIFFMFLSFMYGLLLGKRYKGPLNRTTLRSCYSHIDELYGSYRLEERRCLWEQTCACMNMNPYGFGFRAAPTVLDPARVESMYQAFQRFRDDQNANVADKLEKEAYDDCCGSCIPDYAAKMEVEFEEKLYYAGFFESWTATDLEKRELDHVKACSDMKTAMFSREAFGSFVRSRVKERAQACELGIAMPALLDDPKARQGDWKSYLRLA